MFRFALRLIRPYTGWLIIVIVAMLIETAMSLASPWPLKIVLDSVLDARQPPEWLIWIFGADPDRMAVLKAAVVVTIAISLAQGTASYLDSYYSSNIGQWIGHDLRQTMYAHLQRLSMSYYDRNQVGPLVSTLTDDINAVQDFISTSLLKILVDLLTIGRRSSSRTGCPRSAASISSSCWTKGASSSAAPMTNCARAAVCTRGLWRRG
ncbi:MAG TPA: ABC transporter transmembrane domain-containing protein [Vicinamibacterales bacterium]|nr:ABC transporter transmembrane domain-containing protein [Vicinamibacterales bacterium]